MSTSLTFLGATDTVTGSRFLIESDELMNSDNEAVRYLVDAGLFQGTPEIKDRNYEPFPKAPDTFSAIVLTHAHLDHCGYLPLLVKQGFTGPIFCTEYTAKLAEVILRDSARIQAEDAKYATRKGYSRHKDPHPLYDDTDVDVTIKQLRTVDFRTQTEMPDGGTVTFYPSGHILGSSFAVVTVGSKKILFTGDMGRPEHPLLAPPDPFPNETFDAVVSESTYGNRVHETESVTFPEEIRDTLKNGGSVLIPAFAVDRTEVMLLRIRELIEQGDIPKVPVYVDSPMALTSLAFYRDALDRKTADVKPEFIKQWHGNDPFDPGTLHEMRTVDQSKSLNDVKGPCIIISASGMATGGRVVHHLAHMLPFPKNTVILVGYQAVGTRGRQLEQGVEEIKIHGELVPVRARIVKADSFSVHADANELLKWFSHAPTPPQVFVVHGETDAATTLADRLKGDLNWKPTIPQGNKAYEI